MPRIVRPMKKDTDDLPRVDSRGTCLGVRISGPYADVQFDASGNVKANKLGMSVSETWRTLPGHLIPDDLDDGKNDASGKGMAVFVHGTGPFTEGVIASGLEMCFKVGKVTAGHVCPEAVVSLKQYQSDLAATRGDWVIDDS